MNNITLEAMKRVASVFDGRTLGQSYAVRTIDKWFRKNGVKRSDYEFHKPVTILSSYDYGINWKVNNFYTLSIQTDSLVAGNSFAETLMIHEDKSHSGYDCERWMEPEKLFSYMSKVQVKFAGTNGRLEADFIPFDNDNNNDEGYAEGEKEKEDKMAEERRKYKKTVQEKI